MGQGCEGRDGGVKVEAMGWGGWRVSIGSAVVRCLGSERSMVKVKSWRKLVGNRKAVSRSLETERSMSKQKAGGEWYVTIQRRYHAARKSKGQ